MAAATSFSAKGIYTGIEHVAIPTPLILRSKKWDTPAVINVLFSKVLIGFGNIEIRTEKCIHVNAACTLNARVKSVAATSRTSLGFFEKTSMNQIGSCALKADTVTCQAQVRLSGFSNRESSEYSSFWMNPSVLDAGLQLASTCSRAGANIAHLKIPASMAYYASPFLMTGILKCNYFASSYIQENTCSLESNVEVASFAATKSCSLKRVSHKLINAPGAAFYDSSKESLHTAKLPLICPCIKLQRWRHVLQINLFQHIQYSILIIIMSQTLIITITLEKSDTL